MPFRFVVRVLTALALLSALVSPGHAEETGGSIFRDALGKLMGTKEPNGTVKGDNTQTAPANVEVSPQVPASAEEIRLSFSPVVKKVADSVVNVYGVRRQREARSPFAGDPFFERFFGQMPERRKGNSSLGSGVVASADGIILTNNHVIANMDDVKIALADGREFECDIVLADEKSDLAVLKVRDKAAKFQPIAIADSDAVAVGDLVLAIGNPFGVGQTVTMGIVSAVSRTLAGVNDYNYFIQTDASINPGNSGGALVDMNGRLIGINTMIYSRSGGSVGIGYAIPSNMTRVVLNSAQTGNKVLRPWLGASFQPVSAEIAESLGLDRPRGALVTAIAAKSPAAGAGLQPGDIVVAIEGNAIDHPDALGYRLDTAGVGARIDMTILSRGREKNVEITLLSPPESVPREEIELPQESVLWGAKIANLSPAVAQEIGLASGQSGVVMMAVAPQSPAALNGMRRGDVVREINGVEIANTKKLLEVSSMRTRAWQFVVERGGRTLVFERNGGFFRQLVR